MKTSYATGKLHETKFKVAFVHTAHIKSNKRTLRNSQPIKPLECGINQSKALFASTPVVDRVRENLQVT